MTVLATASLPVSHSLPCLQPTWPPRRALILLVAGHWPTKLLNIFFFFFLVGGVLHSIQDLSSPTRDRT